MKLSKSQHEVISLMKSGWQLGKSRSFGSVSGRVWLQRGGIGRSGESVDVNRRTLVALEDKGLIEIDSPNKILMATIYKLTTEGEFI